MSQGQGLTVAASHGNVRSSLSQLRHDQPPQTRPHMVCGHSLVGRMVADKFFDGWTTFQKVNCPFLDRRACHRTLALSAHGQTSTTVVAHTPLSNLPARIRSAYVFSVWPRGDAFRISLETFLPSTSSGFPPVRLSSETLFHAPVQSKDLVVP